MPLAEMVEQSFMYQQPWPPGLQPTSYRNDRGEPLGYGWRWPELGLHHAHLFGPDEFKESAVRLWLRESTSGLQLRQIPERVVEVEFDPPWDQREPARARSGQASAMLEFERGVDGSWLDLHVSDGVQLQLGYKAVVYGDPWTRIATSFKAEDINGTLGLRLPAWSTVARGRKAQRMPWLARLVPLALDEDSYRTVCRTTVALERLAANEEGWLADRRTAVTEMAQLARLTSVGAPRSVSRAAEKDLSEPTGVVRRFLVPDAARVVDTLYPELEALSEFSKGEYLLGYLGKARLGHAQRPSLQRDECFVAYAVLRNLGVDPEHHKVSSSWLGIHQLVRLAIARAPAVLADKLARAALTTDAKRVNEVLIRAERTLANLDPGSHASRLDGWRGHDQA